MPVLPPPSLSIHRRAPRRRRLSGIAVATALLVSGCATGPGASHRPARVPPSPPATASIGPTSTGPTSTGPTSTGPTSAGSTGTGSTGAGPAVGTSRTGAGTVHTRAPARRREAGSTGGWTLADIPTFRPAPTPVRVALRGGPAAPHLARIPTTQPVAFLTIDDGFVKSPEAPKLIAAAHLPVTLFLTIDAVRDNPGFFAPMQGNGAVIEAHTITHTSLRGRPYPLQHHEVCGSADRLGSWYGRRPVLFRAPFGNRDGTTLRAARACGMRAVLSWKETVHKGKVRYQEGHRIKAGDIILMHFRPAFVADFLAALRAIHRAGLTPALLEDYLPR